mmetsp:Transcript_1820/g.5472  ORF Transcript_1820/g.5472 Transcript_1820/m.5472 type:complete len:217 (-) Transcript_1820:800-1450(-)
MCSEASLAGNHCRILSSERRKHLKASALSNSCRCSLIFSCVLTALASVVRGVGRGRAGGSSPRAFATSVSVVDPSLLDPLPSLAFFAFFDFFAFFCFSFLPRLPVPALGLRGDCNCHWSSSSASAAVATGSAWGSSTAVRWSSMLSLAPPGAAPAGSCAAALAAGVGACCWEANAASCCGCAGAALVCDSPSNGRPCCCHRLACNRLSDATCVACG